MCGRGPSAGRGREERGRGRRALSERPGPPSPNPQPWVGTAQPGPSPPSPPGPGDPAQCLTLLSPGMESLPEAVLIRILAAIPAVDLVLVCRLVCCQWKNLVDGAALWILKCQQEGLTGAESEEDAENWQNFYFLSKKRKNLIKNPCGEEDLEHWGEVENGGDGWKIEELPGDFGKEFPSEEVHKYFVTSYEWCRKAQVIDLRAEGYWEELMDTTQPKIVVRDWYAGRRDAGCLYELCVKLLSENEDVLAEYKSETVTIPQDNDGSWTEISHTFSKYGPGVRFVRFEHGGQDTLFWKGWYGARVTSSSVTVEP
ncbi:F-box only protein 2 [Corapipo altera]|uniref:F-box only protein 2 n=1 Tax=Corapipo altera TaxID=415028 RepID=UPI000FD62A88|nr:F-box only protein 2 [Corapipo altera]